MSGALGFVLATYAVPSPLGDTGLPTKLPLRCFFCRQFLQTTRARPRVGDRH